MTTIEARDSVVEASLAYDEFATRYDGLLTENRINAYMRREMTRTLLSTFEPGSRLVELGCGTGDEAIALARSGCTVIALDPSAHMVKIASNKVHEARLENAIKFQVSTAAHAAGRLAEAGIAKRFDGAYASFSLSYEPDLRDVSSGLATLVVAGGKFVMAHMNRLCAVELIAAVLSGHPHIAGRRIGDRTVHKVGDFMTPIFPRSTSEILRAFHPHFTLETVRALPAILPPHYANRVLMACPLALELLREVDPFVGSLPVIRQMGDQNVLRLRRTA